MPISKALRAAFAFSLAGFALLASAQDDGDSTTAVQEFLLASSAADFIAHEQTRPNKVRNVHLRYAQEGGGEKVYMLCGQFLPPGTAEQPVWADFATVRTEGYEQWLGTQAAALCNNTSGASQDTDDLSAALQTQLVDAPSSRK